MSDAFFTYHCDACDAPFCERVNVMNLALDHVDESLCMDCLAREQENSPKALSEQLVGYILSRDCFKTPWEAFDPSGCPKRESGTCCC